MDTTLVRAHAAFQESEPGVFVRNISGVDALTCAVSDTTGFTHETFSAAVTFGQKFSEDRLRPLLRASLIRLRHLAPSIAFKTTKLPSNAYRFTYRVPKNMEDAEKWADEVLFFCESSEERFGNHVRVFRDRWWRGRDDNYTHEFYVAPIGGDESRSWTFSLSAHHNNTDGRSGWMIFDELFKLLSEELHASAPPLQTIQWGKETMRLPMDPHVIWDAYPKKKSEPVVNPDDEAKNTASPGEMIPWLYKPLQTSEEECDVFGRISFSHDETERLHMLSKDHKRTITQVVTALLSIAVAESALRAAGKANIEQFQLVADGFANATHLFSSMNFVNMRSSLPTEHQLFHSQYSTPLFCVTAFPLPFPMEPYRKLIRVQKENNLVSRVFDRNIFWDELVKDIAEAWNEQDRSYKAYQKRAEAFTAMATVPEVDMGMFMANAAPTFGSLGDMGRLGILEIFRPSTGNGKIVVDELEFNIKSSLPAAGFSFFEYDGRFQVRSVTGKRFCTEEEMKLRMEIIKELFDSLLHI